MVKEDFFVIGLRVEEVEFRVEKHVLSICHEYVMKLLSGEQSRQKTVCKG